MNQTEIYFARQNIIRNLQIYFLIILGIVIILIVIISLIVDFIKKRKWGD